MKKMNSAGNAVSRRTWLISLSVTLGLIILIELLKKLNSIIGFTGIVLQGMCGPLNDEQAKHLSMVKDSENHLLALINVVLDISNAKGGFKRGDSAPVVIPTEAGIRAPSRPCTRYGAGMMR